MVLDAILKDMPQALTIAYVIRYTIRGITIILAKKILGSKFCKSVTYDQQEPIKKLWVPAISPGQVKSFAIA